MYVDQHKGLHGIVPSMGCRGTVRASSCVPGPTLSDELDELSSIWIELRLDELSQCVMYSTFQPNGCSNPLLARPWAFFYTIRGYHSGLETVQPTLPCARPWATLRGPRLTLATGGTPRVVAVSSAAFRYSGVPCGAAVSSAAFMHSA